MESPVAMPILLESKREETRMTAKQAYALVIGMIIMTFIQAMIKSFVPTFPFTETIAAQWGGVVSIMTTKALNDTKEMRYIPSVAIAKAKVKAEECANGG